MFLSCLFFPLGYISLLRIFLPPLPPLVPIYLLFSEVRPLSVSSDFFVAVFQPRTPFTIAERRGEERKNQE
jgi:hypothetical protein